MSALTDLIAGLSAGGWDMLSLFSDATSGYAASVDTPIGSGLSQSMKCCWDWTPWRTYGNLSYAGVWTGYLVNHSGGYTAGSTSVAVDTGTKKITAGDKINFQNVPGTYTVVTGFAGGSGTVTITPALSFTTFQPGPLADNAQVAITHTGRRMFIWAHAHTAANHPWAAWSCYEEYDNTWRPMPSYQHPDPLNNTDTAFEDIMFSFFHQNNGISLNPAKQYFYRIFASVNPGVISRVNINEFDPLDIGKMTTRALTGTVTMVNGSQTVTGLGTLFNTQVQQGDQVWLNGDATFHSLPLHPMTVSSVQTNTSLTCYNQYAGTAVPGAASARDTYELESHWGFEPSLTFGGGQAHPSCEYWPERDSLIVFNPIGNAIDNGIFEKRTTFGTGSDWVQRFTHPTLNTGDNGGIGSYLHYNSYRHSMLVGAAQTGIGNFSAGDAGIKLYELMLTDPNNPIEGGLTLTALDSMPLPFYGGGPQGGLIWHDPMTGIYYFLSTDFTGYPNPPYGTSPYLYAKIDPNQTLGSQYTQLSSAGIPALSPSGTITVDTVCGVMWDLGAVMFMTNDRVFVHKPSANTRASVGLTSLEKGNMPGAVGSIRFGDNFTPVWTTGPSSEPAFLAAMSGRASGGIDQYRTDGQANLYTENYAAVVSAPWVGNSRPSGNDGMCIPDIDTSVTYKSQSGSLRMTRPRMVADNVGGAQFDLDGGIGTGHNNKIIHPAHYGLSAQYYFQYPLRLNPYMLVQYAAGSFTVSNASISVAGSTTLTAPADSGVGWVAGHVNQYIYINEQQSNPHWIPGFYQVQSVSSSSVIVVDRCPVASGFTATGGSIYTQALDAGDFGLSSGFKTDLLVGNAPYGESSSANIEVTTTYDNKPRGSNQTVFYPQMYGLKGNDTYAGDQAMVGPLVADTWHILDKSIKLNPAAAVSAAVGRRGKRWGDWTSGGAGSVRIHSNVHAADLIAHQSWFSGGSGWIFVSGYGPRSAAIGASNWVRGIYLVDHVDTSTGEIVLTTSPTPSGAGSEGEIWILTIPSQPGPTYIPHEAQLRVDGANAYFYDRAKIRLAPGSSDPEDRYGPGQHVLSIFHTSASASFDPGGTALTYYGHMTGATQPIPYLTADSVTPPPATAVRFFPYQVRK